MFRSHWIHKLLGLRFPRNLRRRQGTQTRNSVRLVLEALEDRVTPAQTAGSYTDLVNAIGADTGANTNYVIDITNNVTFTAGQQATISSLGSGSTLTLEGQNGTNFTLTGNGNRLFTVTAGQNVTLDNLTLTGGNVSGSGGAILDQGGNVTLNNVVVQDNTASGTTASTIQGGGVFVSGGGSLTANNSSISNNIVQGFNGTSASPNGGNAIGGGVYVSGSSTVQITDSILSNNRALGGAGFSPAASGSGGGTGGTGAGGGLIAVNGAWSVTLKGDTFSGNAAIGGSGGNGTNGSDAQSAGEVGSNGGSGGDGGPADGGGVYVVGAGTLTILNDLGAPITHPSTFIDNTTQGGDGGTGGAGGSSADGTNTNGGNGGSGGRVFAGALFINGPITGTIGNTTFYGNSAIAGNGAAGGLRGTGGSGASGNTGSNGGGSNAFGGGLYFGNGTITLVNNTVAKNSATGGSGPGGSIPAFGGGIYDNDLGTTVTLDNNTITKNTVTGPGGFGAGIAIVTNTGQTPPSDPTLLNNLIENNSTNGSPDDLASTGSTPAPLTNATNNFISTIKPNIGSTTAVNTATNLIGNAPQLDNPVGVTSGGNSTGGPIYYPLLSGVASVGAGTTNVLSTIAGVEGVTPAADEIGDLRTTDGTVAGSISLGAVQPLAPSAPQATTVAPANASVNFYGANPSPAFQVSVGVNASSGGAVGGGVVALSLVANNTTTPLGFAVVGANGIATVSVPAGVLPANLPAGNYELLETFSGNGSFAPNDAKGILTVISDSTSVVGGNASLNAYGASSPTFTITVPINSPTGTVNGGSVNVSLTANNTTTPIGSGTVTGGSAAVTVAANALPANLQPGSYQLIESYSGNPPFVSSSGAGTLTVTLSPTAVAAGNASLNYNGVSGSPAFSVVVGVNSPDGTVTTGSVSLSLVSGATTTSLGSASVSSDGTATVSVAANALPANLQPGTYQLIETYTDPAGDQFAGSTAQGTLTITTSATAVAAGNASLNYYGGTASPAFSIFAGVNSSNGTVNTGSVSLSLVSGTTTTSLGSAPVSSSGTATVSVAAGALPANLQPGTYQLVETYTDSAGGQFGNATAQGTLTITTSATAVAAGNASLNNYGATGSPAFSIVAGVNSPAGTVNAGSVSLSLVSGTTTTSLGSAPVSSNGTATVSVAAGALPANLQPGTYQLVETYSGSSLFPGSSAFGTLTINGSAATSVVAGNAGINLGSNSPFTISVGVNSPSGTVNAGSVTLSLVSGNTTINLTPTPVNVSGGTADVSVTNPTALTAIAALPTGPYQLVESYTDVAGGQFGSASADGTLTVSSSSITVVAGNAGVSLGSSSPFSISVAVNSPNGTVTTGNVSVSLVSGNTTTSLGTGPVSSDGTATVSVAAGALPANLQPGTYQLVETYTGIPGGQFGNGSAFGSLTVTTASTAVVAGDAGINLGRSSPFTISVGVNSPSGTINSGSVAISLVAGNTTVNLTPTPVNVVGGIADVSVSDPAALAAIAALPNGTYQLDETYTGSMGTAFTNSSAFGTLTISTNATTVVPGSAGITAGSNSPFAIAVGVNSPAGTVNEGSVSISLVSGTTTTELTTTPVSVSGGVANVTIADPTILNDIAALPAAGYQLVESYSDQAGGPFSSTSALGTLTVKATATPSTSIIPSNAAIDTNGGTTTIPVLVNSSAGTVNSGTVTVSLVNGGTSAVVGSAGVSGGSALVTVSLPANLSPGNYPLVETYSDVSGHFNGSSVLGNLNVQSAPATPTTPSSAPPSPAPLPPLVADLEIAFDAAALALQNNPVALLELQLFSQQYLQMSIPDTVPDLLAGIFSLYPMTDTLGLDAILAGLTFAGQLENS